jgi:GT2 family glycosyltransferase
MSALEWDVPCEPREIIVVDNASSDGSADMIEAEFPNAKLLRNSENQLYAEGNNQGARVASGRYLCLLNSDTEVRPGALDFLTRFLESHPTYAAAAPRLVNPDGSVQRACRRLPTLLDPILESTVFGQVPPTSWLLKWGHMADFDHEHSRDVPQPPGACLMTHREEFMDLGGLDAELSLFFNDVDFCRTLWNRGRRIRYVNEVEVLHHGGASTRNCHWRERNSMWIQNRAQYFRKHYGRFGERWLRIVTQLWCLENRAKIRLGPRDARAKRAALDELRAFVQKCHQT